MAKFSATDFVKAYVGAENLKGLLKATGLKQEEIQTRISQLRSKKIAIPTLIERGFVEAKKNANGIDVKALNEMLETAGVVGAIKTRS